MPIQVNVQNGNITPAGSSLTPNCNFEWVNPGTQPVLLQSCGNWCTQDTYQVPANGGTASATVLANPNTNSWAFRDSAWEAPGQPHITNPPMPVADEREVA